MIKESSIKKYLWILIIITTVFRVLIASALEFGNDEVYYWTYALYPDLSHFDHPPMVGYFINIFSLNLLFDSELFIRMSGIITGALNTYVIFLIGKKIKDEKAGLISAILYNASAYCFLISNVFIMPDTPMLFFWLLGFKLFVDIFSEDEISKSAKNKLLLNGVVIGMAMLSKYHSAFLWIGAGLYILFFNRSWLKTYQLYISIILSVIVFLPVIIWNFQNNFISFTFQSERVDILKSDINNSNSLTFDNCYRYNYSFKEKILYACLFKAVDISNCSSDDFSIFNIFTFPPNPPALDRSRLHTIIINPCNKFIVSAKAGIIISCDIPFFHFCCFNYMHPSGKLRHHPP